ncbi:MAG: hypothetical protein DRN15_04205 [Thermoprotei archaeon]|nr:MAG: hypothetical protein DRM97_06695 [Thermoprotei archaeon]RLF24106.1 MAG: hypothetical protein DRN15_04205 [Thermoprotei archaeon]
MSYPDKVRVLIKVCKVLSDRGVRYVVIGDSVLNLLYPGKWTKEPRDLTILATEPDLIFETEFYEKLGQEEGWDVGYSQVGTIYYEVEGEVIELYSNIGDIYYPPPMIDEAAIVEVDDAKVRVLRIEDYLVSKAREWRREERVTLSEVASFIGREGIKIDKKRLREMAEYFDEKDDILRKLKLVGLL